MRFRLRYQAHDLGLPLGDFAIGRSPDCQLAVDDPLVSRRHAVLHVTEEGVEAEDLGSRNGVLVNGKKIEVSCPLKDGDRIKIGGQEMSLHLMQMDDPKTQERSEMHRQITRTLGRGEMQAVDPVMLAALPDPGATQVGSSKIQNSLSVLGGVAEKAFALGQADEAERILTTLLVELLQVAKRGVEIDPPMAEQAARYAARLAGATGKGAWLDYVFDLFHARKALLPAPVVDELYTVVRKVRNTDAGAIRQYVAVLQAETRKLNPSERFLLQRIEGLVRLVALR